MTLMKERTRLRKERKAAMRTTRSRRTRTMETRRTSIHVHRARGRHAAGGKGWRPSWKKARPFATYRPSNPTTIPGQT
ncbi:hypothetical protein JG687_00015675 [Phytophthora cactorum]|uniref:Uncharacterized protein n=1 Tax=Phytophthora cactorum TaxID=29920 RepID=A0A8T1TUC2_9STRA|nr:hypothetical protein JG687_00015675 [Phytophthora cactorum]